MTNTEAFRLADTRPCRTRYDPTVLNAFGANVAKFLGTRPLTASIKLMEIYSHNHQYQLTRLPRSYEERLSRWRLLGIEIVASVVSAIREVFCPFWPLNQPFSTSLVIVCRILAGYELAKDGLFQQSNHSVIRAFSAV